MGTNYLFSTISNDTIGETFGSVTDNYDKIHTLGMSEVNGFFSIAISFIALFMFVRAFAR